VPDSTNQDEKADRMNYADDLVWVVVVAFIGAIVIIARKQE
jgi:hypothetical protein